MGYCYVYRLAFLGLVNCVRFTSRSFQTVFLILAVCAVYFINYVGLYMFAPFYYEPAKYLEMNQEFVPVVEQERDNFLANLFQGIYQNFNAEWFEDIGSQVMFSYVTIVFMPIIEFVLLFLWRYICRVYDQGRWFWPHWFPSQTKKKTILSYKALYEGPVFDTQF